MLLIGLTGGIACGKSTVSSYLADHYRIPIIDADKIAREVVLPGSTGYKRIIEEFGDKVENLICDDDNKTLNRAELGKYVFSNPDALKKLNGITHPLIRRQMVWEVLRYWFKFHKIVILDVPLLFESKLDLYCGLSLCVLCDFDIQLKRLQERNPELSEEQCKQRIKSQMANENKEKLSDIVINNGSDLNDLYSQIDSIYNKIEPSWFISICETIFPPLGLLSALMCYIRNSIKFRRTQDLRKKE